MSFLFEKIEIGGVYMKTNAMRILDAKKITYKVNDYSQSGAISGADVAKVLSENPAQVFKTLVIQGKSKTYYVCVIPVLAQLNLKSCAQYLNEKSVDLIAQKELLPSTGYIHGGCSPFGMKKSFRTMIDTDVLLFETAMISGGKVGLQIELDLKQSAKDFGFEIVDLK